MYLGAHVSIAGSFDKCIDRINDLGGNTLMTFASSPRSLQTKTFSTTEIQKYIEKKAAADIGPHFFHGIYLVNLASESKDLLKASRDSLIFYQRLAGEI
jgi:endonuclease IV